MIMTTLRPVIPMPNALSALKVMKKLMQLSVNRKLIDRNIIKDTQLLLVGWLFFCFRFCFCFF